MSYFKQTLDENDLLFCFQYLILNNILVGNVRDILLNSLKTGELKYGSEKGLVCSQDLKWSETCGLMTIYLNFTISCIIEIYAALKIFC